MIRKLRLQFIVISMGGILLVLLVILGAQNYLMGKSSWDQTEHFLETIVKNDGAKLPFSPPFSQKEESERPQEEWKEGRPSEGRLMRAVKYFYVKYDAQGDVLESNVINAGDLPAEDALSFAQEALTSGQEGGKVSGYQFRTGRKEYGTIVVLAETSIENNMLKELSSITLIAAGSGIVIFLLLTILFSRWAVKPIQQAFQKQRLFISNASHELKTPITVISANADVLESEIGENKWLSHIQDQNERMKRLVNELLILARTDEKQQETPFTRFDLSAALTQASLEFEGVAYEAGKTLEAEITPGLVCWGSEVMVRQLAAILLDNAVKHSDKGGKIRIKAEGAGGKARFSVFNTGEGIDDSEREKIFERFYRSDSSRSRETGGYGLGLSIARSITGLHHGKIAVRGEKGKWIKFTVTLPGKL